jgi:predicted DCC family thiol-disulfide oxidoreductase YuxK
MNEFAAHRDGVWFVYDGDCPICTHAAQALRIREIHGSLHLLNAREMQEHPLLDEINKRCLDLDEGMVIYCDGCFYHGAGALRFMARHGETRGLFNYFNKSLFWSESLAKFIYPWMRGTRNLLLRMRKVPPIGNLSNKDQPIFKSIFGKAWDELPPVMRKHYANRPYTEDLVTVEGNLDVMCGGPIRILRSLFLLLRLIPPYNENNVPVTVNFESVKDTREFQFNRTFHFTNSKPYRFRSRLIQVEGNEVIEIMRFGVGWRMNYLWQDGKVILKHRGYAMKLFGRFIPLPLTAILGEGYAEEVAVDDETFNMFVEIRHPWWGKIYGYKGQFKITREA